jgi:hypothetical protein
MYIAIIHDVNIEIDLEQGAKPPAGDNCMDI